MERIQSSIETFKICNESVNLKVQYKINSSCEQISVKMDKHMFVTEMSVFVFTQTNNSHM